MVPSSKYQEEAHELIKLFASFPTRYSELVTWAESERTLPDCNWERIKDFWTHEFKNNNHHGPLEGSHYVDGMGRIYKGAAYYQERVWDKALKHFALADQAFAYENDRYREALTDLAQGLAHCAGNSRTQARDLFVEAKETLASLSHQYWILRERVRSDQCKALCGRLDDLLEELKPGGYYRPRAHMIPAACDGIGDQPLWFTSGQLATEIVMLGKRYRLLSLGERHAIHYRFHVQEHYFTVAAEDDSMINAGIHAKDCLLARQVDSPAYSDVLVVQIDERDGTHPKMIRKLHYDGEFVVLEPANSKIPARRFRTSAAVVNVRGEVVAILEPLAV